MLELSEKEIIKFNKELVELHQRVLVTYLTQQSLRPRYIKKFLIVYNQSISHKNIRCYFHRSPALFTKALLLNRLSEITQYRYPEMSKKKGGKK